MADRANLLSHNSPMGASPQPDHIVAIDGSQHQQQPQKTIFEQSSHPTALLFHILFRTAALLIYLLGTLIIDNFVLIFVICVLLLAFDFWTVKNVTGRLLVGLRWWNEIKENGENEWIFESKANNQPNPVDSRIFWSTLYIFPVVWFIFAISAILKPTWLCITLVALSLNTANLIGYTKCDKDAKKKWAGGVQSVMGSDIGKSVMGGIVSRGLGGFFGGR